MQQNITYFKITTAVDNSSGLLKAGMNATCEITAGEAFNVLIVPREAVTEEKSERTKQTSEDSGSPQKIAFTIRDGKPTPTPVEVGISNYESTEIKSGLSEGDEILVRAKSMVMADRAEFRNRMKRWNSLPGVKKDVGK